MFCIKNKTFTILVLILINLYFKTMIKNFNKQMIHFVKKMLDFLLQQFYLWKYGYLKDQNGIWKRYIIENNNWNSHLENTKAYIKKSTTNISRFDSVYVLGSGWLLDVPLDYLSDKFKDVYLVDISHPQKTKRKIKKYHNIHLIYKDITNGGIEQIVNMVKQFKKYNQKIPVTDFHLTPEFQFTPSPDFIVSLNIMSQLDDIIISYLKKHKIYTSQEIQTLRKIIHQHHIDLLKSFPSCLITDNEEIILDKKNREIKRKTLIFAPIPQGINEEQWVWKFDSYGNYYEKRKTYRNIIAKTYV